MNVQNVVLGKRVLFGLLIAGQLAVPTSMIFEHSRTLQNGERLLFKCRPIDPYDAFRGRYVALGIEADEIDVEKTDFGPKNDRAWEETKAYVTVMKDEEGFAQPVSVTFRKPSNGKLFIKARAIMHYYSSDKNKDRVKIIFPFDRYYMNEKQAPRAERAYRKSAEKNAAHISVRVGKNGHAALEELYIENLPVYEFLSKINNA